VVLGQLLTTLTSPADAEQLANHAEIPIEDLASMEPGDQGHRQRLLFE
jgi:hypothetical protein